MRVFFREQTALLSALCEGGAMSLCDKRSQGREHLVFEELCSEQYLVTPDHKTLQLYQYELCLSLFFLKTMLYFIEKGYLK